MTREVREITSAMLEKQRAEFRAARYRRIMIGPLVRGTSFPFPRPRVYRVYADGREFGIDYSRSEAFAAREKFAREFPNVTYYVRRVR